jgi:hypothetical protein
VSDFTHIFRVGVIRDWHCGRKDQACRVIARGRLNSILVQFADGFTMVTSRNFIRRIKP